MKNLIKLSGFILLAGTIACESGTEMSAPELTPNETTSAATAQAQGRLLTVQMASVDRFQNVEFMLHLDAERGLISAHMPSDVCFGGTLGTIDVQVVDTPSEIEQRIVQTKGETVPVAVYETDSFADMGIDGAFDTANINDVFSGDVAQFCSFLLGPQRIAEGTVRRVSNLSNASFAVRWTGTLETTDGGTMGLTEVYQLTADAQDPTDTSQWRVSTSKILLH